MSAIAIMRKVGVVWSGATPFLFAVINRGVAIGRVTPQRIGIVRGNIESREHDVPWGGLTARANGGRQPPRKLARPVALRARRVFEGEVTAPFAERARSAAGGARPVAPTTFMLLKVHNAGPFARHAARPGDAKHPTPHLPLAFTPEARLCPRVRRNGDGKRQSDVSQFHWVRTAPSTLGGGGHGARVAPMVDNSNSHTAELAQSIGRSKRGTW